MRRWDFIAFVGGAALWSRSSHAQQTERPRRIGVLQSVAENTPLAQELDAVFRKRLQELGWTEGRNLQIEYRWTAGQPDLIQAFAAELVGLQPDIIVSFGAPNLVALKKTTETVPIVFLYVSDPVGMGLVESMGRPGGNITGFAAFEPSLGGKWLELLKEIAPGMTRVAIVYNPNTAPNAPAFVGAVQTAGSSLDVSTVLVSVRDNAEIDRAIGEFAREPGGGLILVPDPFTAARPQVIVAAATRHRLPVISPFRGVPTAGGLTSYGIDAREQNRQTAAYVDRILRGKKTSELPVQLPTKFELIINLKTAKALGLTVPPTLLARADEVIE